MNLTAIFAQFNWALADSDSDEQTCYTGICETNEMWSAKTSMSEEEIELRIYLNNELASITTFYGDVINLVPLAIKLSRNSF